MGPGGEGASEEAVLPTALGFESLTHAGVSPHQCSQLAWEAKT